MLKEIYYIITCVTPLTFAGCSTENSAGDVSIASCPIYLLPKQYLNNNNPAYLIFNKYETLQESIPANFRVIEDYRILASAQFNVKQFQTSTKDYSGIIVIDLRGEYHGLINDIPVSFKALPYNDINANKNHDLMITQEQFIFNSILPKLSQISIYAKNLNVPPKKSDIKVCTQIKNSITEYEAMTNINTMYYRIPVLDHSAPSATNLDALVVLYDTVLRAHYKQWVYLHCQAGKGRTATATAELIMLKQKDSGNLDSFDNIITCTQNVSNGYHLIPKCSVNDLSYRCQARWNRYIMLRSFYDFVNTRSANQTYSQWLNKIVE